MIKHNQNGSINSLLLPLILCAVALVGTAGFAVWAYGSRQDYKTNSDQKSAVAVKLAVQREDTLKDKQFAEDEKNPLRTFVGPEAYGSITVKYPKTWSAYVDTTGNSTSLVDGYFYPGAVPAITGQSSVFALHVQVLNQPYAQALALLTGQQKDGKIAVTPYAFPKVPQQVGVQATGTFSTGKSGTSIYVPLRDKTLVVSTDGQEFVNDFNTSILPNLTFSR